MENSRNSNEQLKLTVRGRVQGVFYRATVASWAEEMGFTGYAHNNPDGSVTVLAQGPRPVLERLISKCYTDVRRARVDNIDAQWSAIKTPRESFEIK